jgi:hypothetical protein
MTEAHGTRSHATWSASSTAANWTCSGRIAMLTMASAEKESEHAARGTAAHECAEMALRTGADAISFLGSTVKTKAHEIVLDEELTSSAQAHVDYVKAQGFSDIMLERKLSLASLNPPFDAGGTCDVIGLLPQMIEVVDLKNGMTVVEVNENKQTRTYALCALLDLAPEIVAGVDRIKVTIVQPRAPHDDGRIRSEEFHVVDLLDWASSLLARMNLSKQALDEFEKISGDRALFDAWAEKWLTTGNCGFCPAAGYCPALKKDALKIIDAKAQQWFEEVDDTALVVLPEPKLIAPAELGRYLDGLEALEGWIKSLRSYAHALAENGTAIPGWQLAESIGNRKWVDEAAATTELFVRLKLTKEQVFVEKLKSPAQIEKVLGAKRKDEIKNLVVRPVTGTNLVASAKTTRPAALSSPEKFFEQL